MYVCHMHVYVYELQLNMRKLASKNIQFQEFVNKLIYHIILICYSTFVWKFHVLAHLHKKLNCITSVKYVCGILI